uniref:non-specific serine/threonine protein kinase n=1 Tax=Oryza barthii TaxID=65489 RepID=A0A0D3GHT9_9ORYZ
MEDLHLSSSNFGGVVPAALAASPALMHILASRFQPTCLVPALIGGVLLLLAGECSSQLAAGDRETLLEIRKGWGKPQQLASWDPAADADHCSWVGVTCSDTSIGGAEGEGERVITGLSLAGMNLTRTIPAAVCDLKNLTWLDLSYNNLSGAFSAWSPCSMVAPSSGSLTSPTTPSTTAPLPRDIGSLSPAMEHINLSSNSFSGGVPSAVAALPALRSLILHTNPFTGVYPAEAISNLSRLESLTLAYNVFALAPPHGAYAARLVTNNLTATIPAWVWWHEKLEHLYLDNNTLTGELPRTVTAVNLIHIDLSINQLRGDIWLYDNNLFGKLPPDLGKHSPINYIVIHNNNLSGTLPETLCANGKLHTIITSDNNFSGNLPANLGDCVIRQLPGEDMNNNFTGALPAVISPSIRRIDMGNNMFPGSIPTKAINLHVFTAGTTSWTASYEQSVRVLWDHLAIYLVGSQLAAGDRDTLVAIRKGWGNPSLLTSWDPASASDHCSWDGVTCSDATSGGGGRVVTELSLYDMNLNGTVPAAVCDLANLTRLDLSYNDDLSGAFPAATLYRCSRLRFLNLAYNALDGALPRDIGNLSLAMEHLNLSWNSFSGTVPTAVAALPALRSLILDTNRFTGVYPAAEIGELVGLECLTLADNAFAPAPVPVAFARLTKLTYLWMSEINIIGEIPEAFSSLTELTLLDLSSNNLTGAIPAWVWRHEKLEYLYLYENNLTGELPRNVTTVNLIEIDLCINQLRGEMSEDFGNLKNLTSLSLCQNNLTGMIPASIGLLPKLSHILLADNNLFGELPPDLGKHSLIDNIRIANNNLSGSLPATLCANGNLNTIAAFNNNFSGNLPANLGDCVLLHNLMLANNRFSGDFPEKIWLLPKLETVTIQNNNFTGALPTTISPNMYQIEMGNNMFSGSIPRTAINLQVFRAENNQLDGELPADMSKLANLIELKVPGNRITGPIPALIKLLLNLKSLNLSGNQLTGAIPYTCLLAVLIGGVVLLLLGGEGSSQLAVGDRDTLVAISKGWGNPRHLASWDPAAAAADHCSRSAG